MRTYKIEINELIKGNFEVIVTDSLSDTPVKILTQEMSPEKADCLIDSLNLRMKERFPDYEPVIAIVGA